MMRWMLAGLISLFALPGAAQACVCLGPQTEEQKRDFARAIAERAVAVAEVEQIADMDAATMTPERYRVIRLLAGQAPATFHEYRRFASLGEGSVVTTSYSDCDAGPAAGERAVVVLFSPQEIEANPADYAAEERFMTGRGDMLMWSMCEKLFAEQQGGLALILDEARKLGKAAR
ncbi:hypothetical protein H8M03_05460 [Sphingomonas sabuli]|uniref:Uncharacterized protein n=1 Tax=Sphingomonas sabuli TaxID=2764186 RepID=A0A7G9L569_9SPHN|nr:hypothetical protein [Sphingomonas sabuli]QNM83768.1 hypothetical protein H8M03_05460 [Sphingomonas sabuli]